MRISWTPLKSKGWSSGDKHKAATSSLSDGKGDTRSGVLMQIKESGGGSAHRVRRRSGRLFEKQTAPDPSARRQSGDLSVSTGGRQQLASRHRAVTSSVTGLQAYDGCWVMFDNKKVVLPVLEWHGAPWSYQNRTLAK
jgi:hypothetical protein